MWIDKGYQCDKCRRVITKETADGIFVKVGEEIVAEICFDHASEFKELIRGGLTSMTTARVTKATRSDGLFIRVGNDVVAVIADMFFADFKALIQKELVTLPGPPPNEAA